MHRSTAKHQAKLRELSGKEQRRIIWARCGGDGGGCKIMIGTSIETVDPSSLVIRVSRPKAGETLWNQTCRCVDWSVWWVPASGTGICPCCIILHFRAHTLWLDVLLSLDADGSYLFMHQIKVAGFGDSPWEPLCFRRIKRGWIRVRWEELGGGKGG